MQTAVAELILIRHGESMGNAAAAAANAAQAEVIVIDQRDADVPLSPIGLQQAEARWRARGAALRRFGDHGLVVAVRAGVPDSRSGSGNGRLFAPDCHRRAPA